MLWRCGGRDVCRKNGVMYQYVSYWPGSRLVNAVKKGVKAMLFEAGEQGGGGWWVVKRLMRWGGGLEGHLELGVGSGYVMIPRKEWVQGHGYSTMPLDYSLQDAFRGIAVPPVRLRGRLAAAAEAQWMRVTRRSPRQGEPRKGRRNANNSNQNTGREGHGYFKKQRLGQQGGIRGSGPATVAAEGGGGGSWSSGADGGWLADVAGEMATAGKPYAAAAAAGAPVGAGPGRRAHSGWGGPANVSSSAVGGAAAAAGGGGMLSEVVLVLRAMGLSPQVELLTRDGLFSVDICVIWKDR